MLISCPPFSHLFLLLTFSSTNIHWLPSPRARHHPKCSGPSRDQGGGGPELAAWFVRQTEKSVNKPARQITLSIARIYEENQTGESKDGGGRGECFRGHARIKFKWKPILLSACGPTLHANWGQELDVAGLSPLRREAGTSGANRPRPQLPPWRVESLRVFRRSHRL